MPFGRLHEEAAGDSKLLALSDAAWRMWGMGLVYCQKNLTDGFIPRDAIRTFGVRGYEVERIVDAALTSSASMSARARALVESSIRAAFGTTPYTIADELCRAQVPNRAPLWERVEGGFRVHDYLDWNDSREDILKKRADSRDRLKRYRERHDNALQDAHDPTVVSENDTRTSVVRGSSDQEKESAAPKTRHIGDGAFGSDLPRYHRNCAECSPNFAWCVPAHVHGKLRTKIAPRFTGDTAAAEAALRQFYRNVWSGLEPGFVIANDFQFWDRRFEEAFGTPEKPRAATRNEPVSNVSSADETRRKYLS